MKTPPNIIDSSPLLDACWILPYEASELESLYHLLVAATQESNGRLEKEYRLTQDPDYLEHLAEHFAENERKERLALLLCAMGLYHYFEGAINEIVESALRRTDMADDRRQRELYDIHKWPRLKNCLKMWFGIDMEDVRDYASVNELRVLCNAVKHNRSKVNKELFEMATDRFKLNKEIPCSEIKLGVYVGGIGNFVVDLVQRINNSLVTRLSVP